MYQYLRVGVGYDPALFKDIRTIGYNSFDPWVRVTPSAYCDWLINSTYSLSADARVIIEGGSTTFLAELLRRITGDRLPIRTFLRSPTNSRNQRFSRIAAYCDAHRISCVAAELRELIDRGLLAPAGFPRLRQFERIMTQPDDLDPNIAWALRAAAGIYYPALLFLQGHASVDETCVRTAENVLAIQDFQLERLAELKSDLVESDEDYIARGAAEWFHSNATAENGPFSRSVA
jgi:hypothetical protein